MYLAKYGSDLTVIVYLEMKNLFRILSEPGPKFMEQEQEPSPDYTLSIPIQFIYIFRRYRPRVTIILD